MTQAASQPVALPLEAPAAPPASARAASPRLPSLDVFRGLVILAMLIVNNIGDNGAVGYFWNHADWRPVSLGADFRKWWGGGRAPSEFPLFHHCTLADFVMPMFMLIIGIAIPFSVASANRRGVPLASQLFRTVHRGATLYVFGWIIDASLTFLYWTQNTKPDARLSFTLGMNVLQLLGVGYIVARLFYLLPLVPRLALAGLLYVYHWALLRYLPQGATPAGTFTEPHNAVGYLYGTLWVFHGFKLTPWLGLSFAGMLSVPPAAATMLLGTFLGDTLRNPSPRQTRTLVLFGLSLLTLGVLWAFDLPMNKPRWTPCYLLYCAGVGTLLITVLHRWLDDSDLALVHASNGRSGLRRKITLPLVVLGVNPIGIYFLSILFKIWCLNLPRVNYLGKSTSLTSTLIQSYKSLAGAHVGSWLFTLTFLTVVWVAAAIAYRRNWIWKV